MTIDAIAWVVQEQRKDALRAAEQSRLVRLATRPAAGGRAPLRARFVAAVAALLQSLSG
jgi:hypothetical protein